VRPLVASGAAGGIAATFNAPIAGVFFALELIVRNFRPRSFGLVALSAVTAAAIARAAFGDHTFLSLPGFGISSPLELVLYAGLGVLCTGVPAVDLIDWNHPGHDPHVDTLSAVSQRAVRAVGTALLVMLERWR
jgi:H+/Cl- antiporter ClcA